MTWLSLLRRAWAAWKLYRKKFTFCDCGEVVTPDELERNGARCDPCKDRLEAERAKANNDIARHQLSGFATLLQPGLQGLFNQQMNQQRQQQLADQVMNQHCQGIGGLLGTIGQQQGLLGQLGIFPPSDKKQQ